MPATATPPATARTSPEKQVRLTDGDPGRGPELAGWAATGLAALVGLLWGAATSGLQTVLPSPFAGLADAVGPWVAAAFLVGALSRSPRVAGMAGVLACAAEVVGYYVTCGLRGFGVNPTWVSAGWIWRRGRSLRRRALGAALLGGMFLVEGAIGYAAYLQDTGDAVVFCVIGAPLVLALGGTAHRAGGSPVRGIAAAATWLLVVLPIGAAGEAALRGLVG